jgi:tyrocidine synthetase-3
MNIKDKEKAKFISSQKIKEKNYWLENLSGELEKTGFPPDLKNLKAKEFSREITTFVFPEELFSSLMHISKASDLRLHIILSAAVVVLLGKYTGSSDIIYVSPIYKQRFQGEFINTVLVLRNRLHEDMTFKELLHQVSQALKNASENQNYPLEVLMEQLNIPLLNNEYSLLDTAVLLENIHDRQYLKHIRLNMIFSFTRTGTSIEGTLEYNSQLYKKATTARIVNHLENLLNHVLHHPDTVESDIPILSEDEKKQLLFDFNDTAAEYPWNKVIGTIFAEQVEKAPHHIAVSYHDTCLTYEELNNRANHTAVELKEKGAAPGIIVGLLLDRSVEMITAVLAILKAGSAYLPIDPDYPGERIKYILKDSNAVVLLTTPKLQVKVKAEVEKNFKPPLQLPLQFVNIETGPAAASEPSLSTSTLTSTCRVSPANLAYVIYTSGTTGKPKGVVIEHRNVIRLLFNRRFQFDFTPHDTWTMFHSYCFDFSVWEMYGALLYGGQLVVIPRRITMDPARYLEILKQRGVTVLNQTPTAFYNLAAEELKQPGKALCLKYVIFGGEALNPLQLKDWKEKYPETKLVNMFGITETTVHVTYKEIGPQEIRFNISNIGTPIPTLCTYVMDKKLALRPIGAPGELLVGGAGVGRGYLNQPELTKEKFVENPHKPGERLYKSGDLVKLSDSGEMEYLGRIDHQVQVRGFRVELGEIQAHLLKHKEIKEALVLALQGETGDKSLCAYIVSHKDLEVSALREYLSRGLPAYMIPAYFVRVEQIPLTANGKVDRKALPHPQTPVPGAVYTAPRNEIEETLASIWASQLDLERVGIHEDYFNIGGDSIKAIRLLNSINDTLHTHLKIVDLFAHETIEKLAQRITRGEIDDEPGMANQKEQILQEIQALKTRIMEKHQLGEDIEDIYPMSDIEKGMVYYTLKDPADAAYHDQMLYHVKYREFNPQTFKRALQLMAEKHPILRTSFHMDDYEEPVHMVRKSVHIDMEHMDISHMKREEQAGCVKQFLLEDRKRGFDVTKAPLWRVMTFQLSSEYLCVALIAHHAVLDGWSVAAFLTELNNTYIKIKVEPEFVPGKLASTYKDFIVEQYLEKKKHHAHEYWKKELQDYKRLGFIQGKAGDTFTAARVFSMNLGKNLQEELKKCASQWNTTIKNLCLAAYIYMLNMVSYENDIVVGVVTNSRPLCEDGDKILGCFLNTVPFRQKIPNRTTWARYVQIVNREQLEAAAYNRISLFEILRIIGENPGDSNPIFDTIFNFVDFYVFEQVKYEPYGNSQVDSTLPLPVESYVKTNTLLDLSVDLSLGGFIISVNYTNSSFNREEIQTLCDYFLQVLKAFVSEPYGLMSKDKIISPADREKLLFIFNRTGADYPRAACIHELFEQQVERRPHQVALVGMEAGEEKRGREPFGEMHLSYRELNEKSHQLAHRLREKGVKADTVVGIMVGRSLEMMIGIFGILKAGGAYMPVDPGYPQERINYMLNDSSVRVLATTPKLLRVKFKAEVEGSFKQPLQLPLQFVNIEAGFAAASEPSLSTSTLTSTCQVSPANLAYIIYTSGSTGTPKGVLIRHGSVVNRLNWMQKRYPLDTSGTLLQKTPFTFDVSVWEIFWWSQVGAVLCLLEPGGEKEPPVIFDTAVRHRVTVIHFVPSMLTIFLDYMEESGNGQRLKCLKQVIASGEALTVSHVGKFNAVFGKESSTKLANLYGPTEVTVDITAFDCPPGKPIEVVPIGKPIDNINMYILDRSLNLQPVGVPGELYTAGVGVARGYLNRPDLTAERFLPVTLLSHMLHMSYMSYMSYIYKTGDLGRWQPDGNIEFLGRSDDQVKIRGNRIELGEIESRLKHHPDIKEAAVVVNTKETVNSSAADDYLCAYLVAQTGVSISTSRLRVYLQRYLPGYMVPSFYVSLEKLPLTPSGKLNRKALPHPGIVADQPYSPPHSDVEKKLVEIWAQVLNIKQENTGQDVIGIDANFFRWGGHSLTAVILASRIHKEFGVRISLGELFKIPTIRAIAAYIKTAQPDTFPVIRSLEEKEYYLLSFSQRRLYFLHRMEETGTAYNIPFTIRLYGDIHRNKLEKTVNRLVQRHESLRTSFVFIGDVPLQRIHHCMPFKIKYYNFAAEGTAGRERVDRIIENFVKPFDLSRPPLLRIGLIKVKEKQHLLVMDMHHIISDGVSFTLLVTDFLRLYQEKELPGLNIRYKDFAQWQQQESQKQAFARQQQYWIKQFGIQGDIPVLNLPTDYTRPAIQGFEGSTIKFEIDGKTTAALKKFTLQQGSTLYMILLALYYVFLAKVTNQEDIVVGTPVAGRRHADLEHIIGMFVNTLALRGYPNGDKTFKQFLKQVKENTLAAFENQDYPFEDLIEMVYTQRDTSRNPLFDTLFVMQNIEMSGVEEIPGLTVLPYEYQNKTAKFDLTLQTVETGRGLHIEFEYCTRLFNRSTVERFARYFQNISAAVSRDIEASLFQLEILSKEERHQLLVDFNDTAANYPKQKTLHQLFTEQVEQVPDHIAVVGEEGTGGLAPLFDPMSITYRELNARSDRLAHLLIEKGVQPDTIVGIMMERNVDMVTGLLGILKSGCAYLPLDPEYPEERINYMLADSASKILLTRRNDSNETILAKEMIYISEAINRVPTPPHRHLSPWINAPATSLAYIIYTSGSTGNPKGVAITHRNAMNFVTGMIAGINFLPGKTILAVTTICFDIFFLETLLPISCGMKVVIAAERQQKDPLLLKEIIITHNLDMLQFTPSRLQFLLNLEDDLTCLEKVEELIVGGEAFPVRLFEQVKEKFPGKIYNVYGPTETTIWSTLKDLSCCETAGLTIGSPIANTQIYIVDKYGCLQPLGVPGELIIGGDGVAAGYLNNPEMTAEKFDHDLWDLQDYHDGEAPFGQIINAFGDRKKAPGNKEYSSYKSHKSYVLYKTGDLARWLSGGDIEFLGRMDLQVKIRGFRIELQEIEEQLLEHEHIKEAVVMTGKNNEGDGYLSAYLVSHASIPPGSLNVSALREYLSIKLPHYMIPPYFVQLDKIPLTFNGKVDRKRLPAPETVGGEGSSLYQAPRNPVEKKLVEIWAEVLGIDKNTIGIDDNFFERGGHSLKAIAMTVKIHKEFDVMLPLVDIFKTTTIRGISIYIRDRAKETYAAIEAAEAKDYYPLSSAQKRLYILNQLDPNSPGYNLSGIFLIEGHVDEIRLENTLRRLIERHEGLRTSFGMKNGEPVQRIHEAVELEIKFYDISEVETKVEEEEQTAEDRPGNHLSSVIRHLSSEFIRPFDLSKAPLLRLGLIKGCEEGHLLLIDMHHIITDGTSWDILTKEFAALYSDRELPRLRLQYKDYAQWQRETKQRQLIKCQESYWVRLFSDEVPVVNLPLDYPRPPIQSFEGNGKDFQLTGEEVKGLKKLAKESGATLYMSVLALLALLLSKLSGQEDIIVGTPAAARRHDDLAHIIGIFINTLVMRNYPRGQKTFKEFLKEVKDHALNAFENQEYPFEDLVEQVGVNRDLSRNPLFDVMFIFHNQLQPAAISQKEITGLKLRHYEFERRTTQFDLTLVGFEGENHLHFRFEYCTRLFREETIQRFINYFNKVVSSVLKHPAKKLSQVEVIPEEEKNRLLVEFNHTALEYARDKTIHQVFAEQVERTPDHVALIGKEEGGKGRKIEGKRENVSLTYKELNEKSNQLAHLLKEKGVQPETIVAIMIERSVEMIIGLLGILKTGGAYLPIDLQYPAGRINFILAASKTNVLVTDNPTNTWAEEEKICLDVRTLPQFACSTDLEPSAVFARPQPAVSASSPAYVIFTSGSTGYPKGVVITHRNVVNFNRGIAARIDFCPGRIILALTTISFDIFVLETFLPLLNGLRIVIASEGHQKDPELLGELIVRHDVDMIQVTPSTLHMLLNLDISLRCLEGVKELMVGGEAFPDHLFEKVKGIFRGRIFNMYGPTETTVWSALKELTNEDRITIGTPIANTLIYIVGPMFHLLPIGTVGELCIGGDGVARGYLNRPELTSERFLFLSYRSYRSYIYRTGDLARWLTDGDIEFVGRLDYQVKIRGFRIELGEIENQLVNRDGIKEAVVVVKEDSGGDKYICAYIVPQPGNSPGDTELRDFLAGKLPNYMIPSYFMLLERIPLTPNGKINRKALPSPDIKDNEARTPPRNEVEEKLVGTWSEILGINKERLGIDHNFFQVGGHSLKAVVLVSTIHKEFNVKISLAEFFKAPIIRRLSENIKNAEINRFFSIEPTEGREYYPLSSAQKRLFFLRQIEGNHTAYNMSMVLEWQGALDKARLERTFGQLISRHESLRTSFHIVDNQPRQRIHKQVDFEMEYHQVEVEAKVEEEKQTTEDRRQTTEGREQTTDDRIQETKTKPATHLSSVIRHLSSEFIRPFDLSQAPLLRVGLIRISEKKHIFMTDMHHIVSDGVSIQLLVQDFVRLYAGKEFSPLRLQYKDYSQWQNGGEQKELMEKQREYWIREFAGEIPVLQLPIDYPRPMVQSFTGSTLEFEISWEQTHELRSLASGIAGTLYMVLLALYNVFLCKITGQEDIVIGTPVAGRRHKDLEQIIGNFVNTLALRHRPENGKPFNIFLEEVKQQTLRAFDHQEFPYEDLIEEVGVKRDTSRNPLFDTVFVMHNVDISSTGADRHIGDAIIKPIPYQNKTTKFDLTLGVTENREKLFFYFEYCTELFKSSTVQRFTAYFKEIVSSVLESPAIGLGDTEIIPGEEKQQLLSDFNNTYAHYPNHKTIHQLFGEQVEKTPDHVSVVFEDKALTYKELDRKSNHLAHYLRNNYGLKPEEPVGLLMHRSEPVIVCMLGTLKAGGAYLPIDPGYPESRINYILEDSSARILVSTVSNVSRGSEEGEATGANETNWSSDLDKVSKASEGIELILLDKVMGHLTGIPSQHPRQTTTPPTHHIPPTKRSTLTLHTHLTHPTHLGYIIYTSGSTGKPKGVLVEHRSVVRLFFHQGCLFDFNSQDIWTMFHSPCFDFSVWEMYGALFFGGSVIVVPGMTAREPAKYLELLKTRAVTVLNQTPTAFYALAAEELRHNHKHLHLKYIIFGGEALHPLKLQDWNNKYPHTRLINMFGITETTVHVTFKELKEKDLRQDVRYIGKPIPTLSTYIMDRHQGLAPLGIPGELCVGGAGVARGYLNRVALTAERFIANPFQPDERVYRSGDLARTIETGDMEYLGRMDHQVQLRGFRVELGEIENQLLQHKKIKEAYVIDRQDSTGDKYLCAYIVPAGDLEIPALREYLAGKLPGYMIPSYFVQLPVLPLTPNGKINRQALPDPGIEKAADDSVMPRDEVEKKLAKIWSNVLAIDKNVISIDDNFFQVGGHSLKAGVLAAAVHKEMNVKLPLTEVFITPSIRGMAEFIREAEKDNFLSIKPAGKKHYYPLSSAQRRLHIMQQVNPDITAYNITIIQVIEGKLDFNRLEATFRQLIKRHESLRTSFETIGEEPVQEIHENVEFEIEYYSAAGDPEGPGTRIKNFVRPFDLSQAPLLRVGLIELPHTPVAPGGRPSREEREHKYLLAADMHHIITDGVSANVLIRDFSVLYAGKSLPELKLQYKDFSQWQNSETAKKSIANQKNHWLNLFAGNIPQLDLPIDYPRPENKTFAGYSINFVIGKELNHGLQVLGRETGTTLFMLLLSVYNILLSRYSRQEDIVVGSPITGRRHADLQHIVGMFVNMLALRNHPVGNKTFRTFLAEVKQNALQAYENQDYQFEQLIIDLGLQGTRDRNPLFDVVFAMQKIDIRENVPADFKGIEHLKFIPYPFKKDTTPFDLLMAVYEMEDTIDLTITYSTHLFKPSSAEQIGRHYIEILEQVTADIDIYLHDIQLSHRMVELESRVILEDAGEFGF